MTASDHLGPQWYHGTTAASGLDVGDMITPGHTPVHEISSSQHVYFTSNQGAARKYAGNAAGGYKPGMRVFSVEPTGPYEPDPNEWSDEYETHNRSSSPLRITGRVI